MKKHTEQFIVLILASINLFLVLPALILSVGGSSFRFEIYQALASQFGKPKIIFLGDSITLGGEIWTFRIGRYNLNTWNYGYAGITTCQLRHAVEKLSKQRGTDYAFVMIGINDHDKTVDGAERSFSCYKELLDILLDAEITPIVQLTLYRENETSPEYITRLNALLTVYSKQNGLEVIDLNPVLAPKQSLLPKYSRDGVHINEAAYKLWSKRIKVILDSYGSRGA
ncbi:MAG: hypothetical protein D3924_17365 [Candidatus Electrothrix sp. AR4]|nr:hypothetical protein [Candidatus Electrothrix sp. AR4]